MPIREAKERIDALEFTEWREGYDMNPWSEWRFRDDEEGEQITLADKLRLAITTAVMSAEMRKGKP